MVLAIYLLTPACFRNAVLLLASLTFYAQGEPKYVLLMLAPTLSDYGFGLLQKRYRGQKGARLVYGLSMAVSLSFPLYFKYADFFLGDSDAATELGIPLLRIALPIGINFYTSQIISYTVDVHRGESAQRNLAHLIAYVAMFPQLIAGPIVRYSDIAQQLEHRSRSTALAAEGVRCFFIGSGRKIPIVNQLRELCGVFWVSDEKPVLFYWLCAVAFVLYIYFGSSGYSDMTTSLGKIFGFHFLESFNYPYIPASIAEFWRRQHMSLDTWFRDHVYIPLGDNRIGGACQLLNILMVQMLIGFWHGTAWNFVIWGLMLIALLTVKKLWLLKPFSKCHPFAHLYVVFLVVINFAIFNAENMGQILSDISGLFGTGGIPLVSTETAYCPRGSAPVLILTVFGIAPLFRNGLARLSQYLTAGKALNALELFTLFILLLVMTGYLVGGFFNPLLYLRF